MGPFLLTMRLQSTGARAFNPRFSQRSRLSAAYPERQAKLLVSFASGALLAWAVGDTQAMASADPGPATLQPPVEEPSPLSQAEPQPGVNGVVAAPVVRDDEQCQGKSCQEPVPGEKQEQEVKPPPKKKRQSRMQELQEARAELQAKEQELRRKSSELQELSSEKNQTIAILRDELDIERTLRSLLERDKEKAEEIAALAMNLCSGVTIPP